MRLELADFPVKDVRFSKQTGYRDGVLEINKEELVALILEDGKIASADVDVAFPGEQTRIVKIRDIVEPRVKVSGPGCVFPGILGPVETVGEGRTHKLSGVTVMPSAEYRPTILSGQAAQATGIVDMWGPGAGITPYASTINIVPMFALIDGVTEQEAHTAIQLAEFKLARRLAETTRDMTPENIEVFELSRVDSSLPRIVYILTVLTHWQHAHHSRIACYGLSIRESLPTLIHPNELLDGALTIDARKGSGFFPTSWIFMNHPPVMDLLREHGKRLNFLGVILQRTRFETMPAKQVTAAMTSQMARLLGADGAVTARFTTSGANYIDVMLTVQACERKGIKTVFITQEWGGRDGTEPLQLFYVPEATALVSTGPMERELKLPAPARVIGAREGELVTAYAGTPFSPWNEITFDGPFEVMGGMDWWGGMSRTCKDY